MQREKQVVLFVLTVLIGLVPAWSVAAQEEPDKVEPAPPVVVLAAVPEEPEPTPPAAASEPERDATQLSIGASGLLSGLEIADEVVIHAMWGADLMIRVIPWLYVGLRRMGVSWASPAAGDRFAIGGSPAIGAAWSIGEVVELFGEIGAALQARFGGQLDSDIGVAPFGGVGARFKIAEWISVGLEGTLHVPVTDTFLVSGGVLPGGALWFAGGAGVMFHVR